MIGQGPIQYSRGSSYKIWYWSNFTIFFSAFFTVVVIFSKSILGWPLTRNLTLLFVGILVGSYLLSFVILFFLKCDRCSKYIYEPWKLLVFEEHPRHMKALFEFHCGHCDQKYFVSFGDKAS